MSVKDQKITEENSTCKVFMLTCKKCLSVDKINHFLSRRIMQVKTQRKRITN